MMVMPLPHGRKVPALPVKNGLAKQPQMPTKSHESDASAEFASGAKSPIKKHLKHAAMTKWPSSNPASPLSVSTRAQTQVQVTEAAPHKQIPASGAKMATLRASIIHLMLGLLDQEQATVQGTIPILQTLASLPLENPSVRQDCLQLLQRLHEASFSPSKPQKLQRSTSGHDPRFDAASDIPTSEGGGDEDVMPPSFVYEYDDGSVSERLQVSDLVSAGPTIFKKDSGRAKSLSLHHCKEFLLACANEIHELEDENPNFDYAEETISEAPRHHRRRSSSSRDLNGLHDPSGGEGKSPLNSLKWRSTEFDYISAAASSASVATGRGVCYDDDVQADQGSEFSEVVRRADYMSDFSDDLAFEPSDQEWSGRGRHSSTRQTPSRADNNPREALNLQYRVFSAFKQNGLQSRRDASRKRLAFQNLKTNLRNMQLKRVTMKKLRVATNSCVLRSPQAKDVTDSTVSIVTAAPVARNVRLKDLLSQHLDLVVVLLCAIFLQSMLS